MSNILNIILTIILLVAILGILVSAHEAGHFLFAKLFGVYCNEFSIGFGPKIFSRRRKNGETTISLRAIPLGGYVAMYSAEAQEKAARRNGEDYVASEEIGPNEMKDHNGNPIPLERSLERKPLWQRIIIMLAGVTVNFIISFVFCLIYATAYPQYQRYVGYRTGTFINDSVTSIYKNDSGSVRMLTTSDGEFAVLGFNIESDESLSWEEDSQIYMAGIAENKNRSVSSFILDNDVTFKSLSAPEFKVTALYYPLYEDKAHDLFSSLSFYTNGGGKVENAALNTFGLNNVPNMESGLINLTEGDKITLTLKTIYRGLDGNMALADHTISSTYTNGAWDFDKVQMTSKIVQATYGQRLKYGCEQWVGFFPMMGEALGQLFRFNFDNVGGVVAMGASISSLTSYMGAGKTFFLYGGLISLNLGILNLLPFPGLDGWQVLVAIVEKVARKKVPQKAKQIIQTIGFGLLMVFAVFIMVKDVLRLL